MIRKIILVLGGVLLVIPGSIADTGLKQGELSDIRCLTELTGKRFENVQWSPDGKKIAFTELGYEGLYVMEADGSGIRKISDGSGVGYMYRWSADSREILVRDTRWIEQSDSTVRRAHAAWAVAVDGTAEPMRLTEDMEIMQPGAWRYDARGAKSIAVDGIRFETSAAPMSREFVESGVALSPAFVTSFITDCENLYSVDALGNKHLIYEGEAFLPVLSPDGTRVAFATMADEIKVLNLVDGSQKVVARGFTPTWVNDDQIVYEKTTDDGHTFTSGDLRMVNVTDGRDVALTSTTKMIEMNASASPDGTRIVFTDFNSGQVYSAAIK